MKEELRVAEEIEMQKTFIADVDADGIWEIQGTWEDINSDEDKFITYGWNGQLYGKWPSIPQPANSLWGGVS